MTSKIKKLYTKCLFFYVKLSNTPLHDKSFKDIPHTQSIDLYTDSKVTKMLTKQLYAEIINTSAQTPCTLHST